MIENNQYDQNIVYVLTNSAMPGMVKIGWTSRNADIRSNELFTTGVPQPFDVRIACQVSDGPAVERALHEAFHPYRVNERREFFRVEWSEVEAMIQQIGSNSVIDYITDEVANNPEIILNEKNIRSRPRPRADFAAMGIPVGSEIICVRGGFIAKIATNKTVLFDGSEMSLTAATRQMLPDISFGNSYFLWTYYEEILWTIYNKTYPRPSDATC